MELTAPEFTAALAERGYTPGIDLRIRYGRTRGLVDIAADMGFYNEHGYHNFRELESAFGITCKAYAGLSYACKTYGMYDSQLREQYSGVIPDFALQKKEFFTEWNSALEKIGVTLNDVPVIRERYPH